MVVGSWFKVEGSKLQFVNLETLNFEL